MAGKILSEKSHSGKITVAPSLTSKISSGGVTDHNRLANRDAAEQHPIAAITNLEEILNNKLDSSTAMPLIDNALKNKACGLYFDAKKELNRKAYWYLTSDIDSKTGQGTKESIISGPYDLGMGGGSGGGGTGLTTMSIQRINWPSVVVVGATTKLIIKWSSVFGEQKEPTGNGTIYLTINNKQVEVLADKPQGEVVLDVSKHIVAGANNIQVKIIDSYGSSSLSVATINATTLELKSSFNSNLNFTGFINYTYVPYGDLDKLVHFIVDGKEYGTQVVKSTGESQTYKITGLSHGSHTLEVYFTANIGGVDVTSNSIFYDLVYYVPENETPIIVSDFRDFEQEQYISFNIPYRIFAYEKNEFEVLFLVNDEKVNNTTVGTSSQYWNYINNTPGNYKLTIKCGNVAKDFNVYIKPSTINVVPVDQDLVLSLGTQGRNNNEELTNRVQWKDEKNNISCELTNFNWKSNGWVTDKDGNSILRVSGDARVKIPYKVFLEDFKNYGKTIELELATSAVRNYSTTLISCLDKQSTDFYESFASFAEEDFRKNTFKVNLNTDKIKDENGKSKLTAGSHVFSYTANGWYLDSEKAVDIADYGLSISKYEINPEGTHGDEFLLIGDNIIVNYTLAARGFYVTPQIAGFRSQQSFISTQYKEDEHVRLTFVIEKNTENRIIWMYINGIASGAMQYPIDDNFRQLDPNIIEIGSNDAILDIYNIRVYDNSLNSKQVVNNWIADTQDAVLRATRYSRNDNYNDKNELVMSKLPADLPYIIWDIQPLPQFKGDKRLGNARYVDPTDPSRNFTSERAQYNVQGTSSSVYPTKNIRIKFKAKDNDPNFFWVNDNGDTIKKFPITYPGGIGDNYFTFKVDYASSEGANNVELTKLYNDTCIELGILTPPQRKDLKVRVGIDGFPIAAFYRDEEGKDIFCTKANFNNDKANEDVYGFEEGDESWETTNNSADETKYKVPSTEENFENGFEIRFPDEDDWNGDLTKLKAMTTWVASTNRANATNEELPEPVTYKYKETTLGEDNSESSKDVTKTFTHDTEEYRLIKFRAELPNWFNVDSTLFYYVFTHLYLMIDSRAKNAFPTYFKSRQAGDGGDRWFWIPYDMDTAIGIDNKGKLSFDYNLEDTDQLDGADVYNGQDSVMWCNLRDSMPGEVKAMYAKMRLTKLISYEETEKRFEAHQGQWSENIFNEDAKNKYIAPLANGDNYLEMLQGSKAQQRKWWLYNRFKYMDSKYNAGEAIKDFIQFRAYVDSGVEKPNITITPYADIYATVSYANGRVVAKRAKRNEQIIIENPFETAETENDQETYIYSASQLKSIGDISGFHPDTVKIGNAIKLQELKVGDKAETYSNPYLKELTVGGNTLLKSIDARNCVNLGTGVTSAPDLSQCINLEEIYFTGTKIKGIVLPDGGNIKRLHLPGTLTSLTIKNQPLLTDLNIEGSNTTLNIPTANPDTYLVVGKVISKSDWINEAEIILTDNESEITVVITDEELYNSIIINETSLIISCNKINVRYDLINNETVSAVDCKIVESTLIQLNTENLELSVKAAVDFAISNSQAPTKEDYGTSLIESLWLENIPSESIKSEAIVSKMKSNTAIRLIGINETYNTYEDIERFYNSLDNKKGLTSDGETVNKAQVTGTIHIDTIPYNKYVELVSRYQEIKINANQIVCTVLFDNEGTISSQNIALGDSAALPEVPVKMPTQAHYYTFDKWVYADTLEEWNQSDKITKDLTIKATYIEHDQEYTVTFVTNSDVIDVEPKAQTVIYNTKILEPLTIGVPIGVELIGWFTPDGTKWDFENHTLLDHLELTARWKDKNAPTVTLTTLDATHFKYEASDNLGIVAWAVTLDPTIEPDHWNEIKSTTTLSGNYEVIEPGSVTFWIKDSNNNIAKDYLTVYTISIVTSVGIEGYTLYESVKNTPINNVAISGTMMRISTRLDSHYENLTLKLDDNFIGDNLDIRVNRDITIYLACEPKQYKVSFNLVGKGVAIEDQIITYLCTANKPLNQYWQPTHEVIEGWYLDSDYTSLWDFETAQVLDNTVLYAKWIRQHTPTELTLFIPDDVVPNEDGKYEVILTYSNRTSAASDLVRVDFGDGIEVTSSDPDPIHLKYYYDSPGEKLIKIFGNNRGYRLGYNYDYQVISPISYLTKASLAWDISNITDYMFRESSLVDTPLTDYIISIGNGAFSNCKQLLTAEFPQSLLEINSSAFEGCEKLAGELRLPKHLTKIADLAFSNCSSLENINFGESAVTDIGGWAFSGCTSLIEVDVPETVSSIGNSCFAGCKNLSKVILRNENLEFGTFVFNDCTNLFTAGPIGKTDRDGYPLNIEYSWKIVLPDYTFAAGSNQSKLSEVILPDTLTTIGRNAFQNTKIETIELPPNLHTIREKAFVYSNLDSISIPASVKNIEQGAFSYCRALYNIKLYLTNSTTKVLSPDQGWFYLSNSEALIEVPASIFNEEDGILPSNFFGPYWNIYRSNPDTFIRYVAREE